VTASAYVVRRRSQRTTGFPAFGVFALVGCTALATLTACSSAVFVQAPTKSEPCKAVLAGAPISLLDELQRETTPGDAAAIAWGDPPIVMACGVDPRPTANAQVIAIEGVEWIAESVDEGVDEGTVFTTFNRTPVVQLRVPSTYRPEIDAVSALSALIDESTTLD
jgi:hypothetical protein